MVPFVLLALAVAGPESPSDLPPLTGKDVSARIVAGDGRFYPEAAMRKAVEGSSSAICTIGDDGRLSACQVISEKPEGYNFGGATLKLMSVLQLESRTKDGAPTAGRRFRYDMKFKLPGR